MDEDRRQATRHAVWFPMRLKHEGDVILGVSRDISEVGIKMVTAADAAVGSKVTIVLALHGDPAGEREIVGSIVRIEPNSDDPEGAWPHRVAVAFDERVAQLDPVLEEVTRQSRPP